MVNLPGVVANLPGNNPPGEVDLHVGSTALSILTHTLTLTLISLILTLLFFFILVLIFFLFSSHQLS